PSTCARYSALTSLLSLTVHIHHSLFLLQCYGHHRDLHSFPTRRSSDLVISFVGIGLLILAIALIQLARRKLSGLISIIISIIAYLCLIVGALIVIYIVLIGPTG